MGEVKENLVGRTFGRLTVIARAEDHIQPSGKHKIQYLCECSCPNHTRIIVQQTHLKDGHTTSCGCVSKELASKRLKERPEGLRVTHGKYNTGIYKSYRGMIDRCFRSYHDSYLTHYQNKGVTICKEWYDPAKCINNGIDIEGFREFYNWGIINGYEDGKSIDRIDVNGNYEPSNCRWATDIEQMNNVTTNRIIEFNSDAITVGNLANILGINYNWLYDRLYANQFNISNTMRQMPTPYGFSIPMYHNQQGFVPMNGIYFIDQYGFPVSQNDYRDPQPTPGLWQVDDKGFIIGPYPDD